MTILPPELVLIRCPRCRQQIDVTSITTSEHALCPSCAGEFRAVRFDPPPRETALPSMVAGALDAGQPCANHPRNAAVTGCQRCGSFICALCRIDVDGRTLCPACFERLSSEGSLESTRTTFRDYPGLAGVTATAGCLIWFLSILFGPLAIYYALKGLKQKKEMGEDDGRFMLTLAIGVGALQIIGGAFLIVAMIVGMMR
jgi:hypothetical protein